MHRMPTLFFVILLQHRKHNPSNTEVFPMKASSKYFTFASSEFSTFSSSESSILAVSAVDVLGFIVMDEIMFILGIVFFSSILLFYFR
jgi:hypothetical protein